MQRRRAYARQLDSPLTALGREHARTSGRLLARLGVDAAFAHRKHVLIAEIIEHKTNSSRAGAAEAIDMLKHGSPSSLAS